MSWALYPVGLLGLAGLVLLGLRLRAARTGVRSERAAREAQSRRLCELEKLAARNSAILQNAMDGFFVLGEDYRFLEVNAAFGRMTGYTADELLQMKMTDLEVSAPTPEPGDSPYWRTGLHHFATGHRHKDGHIIRLESCVVVLRDEERKILVGFTRDVTERCRAEEALRKANTRFESLVAGMPLGYIVWSKDLRILEWNPAASAIFGYAADEVVGRAAPELIAPAEEQKAFTEMCRRLLDKQAHDGQVLVNRKKNGEKIRCEWYGTVLPDPIGGVHGVATLVRDVSEREHLEAQLRQSQKLESLGVLAGGVAHDFNNLLVGILGNASLASEQLPPDSRLRPLLERVVNAGRRATDLTQRMLAYAGRATCDQQVMDLNKLVEELADFAIAAIPKSVTLTINTHPDLPLIKADSGQVQQVIMNLIINAAEAIGEGTGRVTVSTWVEELDAERIVAQFAQHKLVPGVYVGLEVADTGCGMSPDVMVRIFDPFFSTKFAGRGLGLSAVLGIVRAHRGAITFSSQEGAGTVFRVLLPAAVAEAQPVAAQPRGGTVPRGSTVLVIDDEEDIRDVVESVLTSRGIKVLTAADGRRGVELFERHADEIDAVLLDMNMPGLSGEAVFEALRTIRPRVKVLLSSGYSEQEAVAQFAQVPLAGFVHKPYTASALVDKIGAALTS